MDFVLLCLYSPTLPSVLSQKYLSKNGIPGSDCLAFQNLQFPEIFVKHSFKEKNMFFLFPCDDKIVRLCNQLLSGFSSIHFETLHSY